MSNKKTDQISTENLIEQAALKEAYDLLRGELGRDPTVAEASARLSWHIDRVRQVNQQVQADLVDPRR